MSNEINRPNRLSRPLGPQRPTSAPAPGPAAPTTGAGPAPGARTPRTAVRVGTGRLNAGLVGTADAPFDLDAAVAAIDRQAKPSPDPRLRQAQEALKQLGYYEGEVNGEWSDETSEAIGRFQHDHDLAPSGQLSEETLRELKPQAPAPAPARTGAATAPTPAMGEALRATEALLTEAPNPNGQSPGEDRTIVRDSVDSDMEPRDRQAVARQAEQNAPLVRERLRQLVQDGRLTSGQVRQYEQLEAAIGPGSARLALQTMALREPPTFAARPNKDGQTLLGALDRMRTTPVQAGIDRNTLLRQTIREVADPSSINQQNRGTCAPSAVQIMTAMRDPAEFVRIVGGLAAQGTGAVTLRSGQTITRYPGSERARWFQSVDDQGRKRMEPDQRSVPNRLWATAMMALGNRDLIYSNYNDAHRLTNGKYVGGGLSDGEVNTVVRAVTGERTQLQLGGSDAAIERLRRATAAGEQVPAGLQWGQPDAEGKIHGGHEVLVTGVSDTVVAYTNPWGIQETMPIADFQKRLGGAIYRPGF